MDGQLGQDLLPSSMWKEKEQFNPFELDPPDLVPPSKIFEENTYKPPTPPSSRGEEEEDIKKETNHEAIWRYCRTPELALSPENPMIGWVTTGKAKSLPMMECEFIESKSIQTTESQIELRRKLGAPILRKNDDTFKKIFKIHFT